jgi:uncharacterized protein YggE
MQPESVIRDAGVATVTVTGEAVIRAEPDEAVLWITLSALETAPGAALADVARRSEALVALLDELQVADADRSTSGITFMRNSITPSRVVGRSVIAPPPLSPHA